MSSFSYSQTTSLKRSDSTHVLISREQAANINKVYDKLDECQQIQDSLISAIDSCNIAFQLFHHSDSLNKVEISLYKEKIEDRDNVISNYNTTTRDLQKQLKRERTKKTIMGITSGTLAIAVFCLIFL